MNAPETQMSRLEIPDFLERKEPAAVYLWSSQRRLVVLKDKGRVDLSADDLRALRRFFDQFDMEGA